MLVTLVSTPSSDHPPPLDFDNPPKSPDLIPIERHGALLLLAARAATAVLYSGHQPVSIPIYPDLASMYANFIGSSTPNEVAFGHPQALLDSLLALTVLSIGDGSHKNMIMAVDEKQFHDFVLSLTSCTARQSYVTIRLIPGIIVHNYPSLMARFRIIQQVLGDVKLQTLKDSGIGWLKEEILSANQQVDKENANAESALKHNADDKEESIFLNPAYFSILFPLLFNPEADLDLEDSILPSWTRFVQVTSSSIHSALSLFYILVSWPALRQRLQIPKTYRYFRTRFLEPLRAVCHAFAADLKMNGGAGLLEDAFGDGLVHAGMMRSVEIISAVLARIEDAVGDAFVVDLAELEESCVPLD